MMPKGEPGRPRPGSLMLILNCLEIGLFVLMFLTDLPASRKRKLTYGLCAKHLRKRRLMMIGAPICFAAGGVLLTLAIRYSSAPVYLGLPAAVLGVFGIAGGPMLYAFAPGPALTGENPQSLWIKGGGKAFLQKFSVPKPKP